MRALIALVIGVLMVISPEKALTTVVKVIAAFLLASGLVSLFVGLRDKEKGALPLMSFNALVDVLLGLVLFLFPGFIANRMQHALWREAISIVENGIADAETVDKAVRYSFGLRLPQLGPLENSDMVGTQLTYNIHSYILEHIEDSHKPSPVLRQMLDEGKLGFKSGEGFMKWTDEAVEKSNADLNEYLIRMLYGK